MRHFSFTDEDWATYLRTWKIPHLDEWMMDLAARGQQYFTNRVHRLGLAGGRALDAGCGVGNWSMALARFFDQVDAIEVDAERLRILEGMTSHFHNVITPVLASAETLPFADRSFDAVLCTGVIFVCDYRKSLAEFARVLKPGAPLYVTYTGKAWWQYTLHERSKKEEACIIYGANAFISLLFRLLDEIALEAHVAEGLRDAMTRKLVTAYKPAGFSIEKERRATDAYARYVATPPDDGARLKFDSEVISMVRAALQDIGRAFPRARQRANALLCLDEMQHSKIPETYRARIARDLLSRTVRRQADYELELHTYSLEPEEMTEEMLRHGFRNIQSASEGCLCLNAEAAPVRPIHDRDRGVFETLALAPDAIRA